MSVLSYVIFKDIVAILNDLMPVTFFDVGAIKRYFNNGSKAISVSLQILDSRMNYILRWANFSSNGCYFSVAYTCIIYI